MPASAEELVARLRLKIADERVLRAVAEVPREAFVAPADRERAWEDVALPIGGEQTISQPRVVARMAELLDVRPGDRVLDVGTGSGYHAAVLARLGARVWSVERRPELSVRAAENLAAAHVAGVTLIVGDGALGYAAAAPYAAINVAAAARAVPEPLCAQLADGGRLVAPLGGRTQRLVLVRRTPEGYEHRSLDRVRFVPLIESPPTPSPETGD